ncbi:MAG: hypothetical protein PHQ13_01090, partial [Rhodoferax sp.]|nr:hypothetical protein [Rhodoferax sp.]
MESAPNTSPRLKPAAPYSSDPRERFEAQRMEGDCKGHSPATRAAMAWIIAATVPNARASQLATWADAQLWQAAKAAHKANPEALHTLPESILQSIAWGEAVALLWGLRGQSEDLPTGPDLFAIINAASPGFGDAIKVLAITPACGFVNPMNAIFIGVLVAFFCYVAVAVIKANVGYDDAL